MDEYISTKEAAEIRKVGLSQHRIAELARLGEIDARRIGTKKWLVKVKFDNNKYELVKTTANEKITLDTDEGFIKVKTSPEQAKHFQELSIVLLALTSNFERYLGNLGTIFDKIGYMIYGGMVSDTESGRSIAMDRIDKSVASNLLHHLREEFPELVDLNEWADLTGDRITPDLIRRLRLKAYQGDFKGKCRDCPG